MALAWVKFMKLYDSRMIICSTVVDMVPIVTHLLARDFLYHQII